MNKIYCQTLSAAFFLTSFGIWGQTEPDSLSLPKDTSNTITETRLPVFNLGDDDGESDMGTQDIAGLLQSSRDIFTSTAGFSFGPARFRIRGYDGMNTTVLINGIPMNDMETGRAIWAMWGGLNDVTRYMDVQTGLTPSRSMFQGIGGYSSISARASSMRKGTKVSYAGTNRAYHHRVMVSHGTGMMKNGWAIAASASRRWASEGYIDGTSFDAWAYYLAIEKRINKKHTIGLTGFGAPSYRGLQSLVVQEAYDLSDNNYYNPNWGYQDGEKRNSRVRKSHIPTGMLSHYWDMNKTMKLTTTAYVSGGRNGVTRLNWYEARDPRPDYYRYLPSYQDPGSDLFNQVTNSWMTDENYRQVNWDGMYNANYKNISTIENVNGTPGNNVTGLRSKYILEEMRNDHIQYGFNSVFEKKFTEKTNFTAGYTANFYTSKNFRVVQDLLGGEFWVDVDQFAERDLDDPEASQNDIDNPNRLVKEGERFGHDYDIHVNKHDVFAQVEHDFKKVNVYLTGSYSHTSLWRTGNVRNGRFPDNSLGDSQKKKFDNFGVKGGATYKITGRHYLSLNGAYLTRAPQARNAFISARTRNDFVNGLTNEKLMTADLNYNIRYSKLKTRFTLYYTEIKDQVWMRSFYHDEYNTLVNYAMTGVNTRHMGLELGIEWNMTPTFTMTGVLAHGESIYNSRPTATISRDNNSELVAENRTVYLKNYRVGGMPQTAAAIGLKYNSPKYWFAGFNVNYFDHIYLDPNPDRRTEEAVEGYVTSDPQWNQILDQTRLDRGITVDLYGGKSWRLKGGQYINVNLSISNLLNNTKFKTGGYEQLRYMSNDIDRFPPKYAYMFGITFFAMVSFSF